MNIIQQRREQRGLSVQNLAKALKVTLRTVERWESGECLPETHRLLELAHFLDVRNVDDLLNQLILPGATGAPLTDHAIRKRLLGYAGYLERVGLDCQHVEMKELGQVHFDAAKVLRTQYEKMIPMRAQMLGENAHPEYID